MSDVTGVILAGGRATRMGGVNKGLVLFRGRPLIEHAIHRLAPQVAHLLINANQSLDLYRALGRPLVSDATPGFAGPLAGLLAGMSAANTPFIITVPCDAPMLPDNLVSRLTAALHSGDYDVAVAKTGDRLQPVFCLCRTALREDLAAFLHHGGRKVEQWLARQKTIAVAFNDHLPAFANFNTREELEAAQ